MERCQEVIQMLLVFLVDADVQPDPDRIAFQGTPEYGSVPRSSAYGIILGKGILFPKTGS